MFSHSAVSGSATPWTAICQASLSFTISQSLLKLMSTESVMPSNHLILCCPLLLPSVFPRQHWCLVFRARKSNSSCSTGSESARRTEESVPGKLCHRRKNLELSMNFLFLKFCYLFMCGVTGSSLLLHRPSRVVASRGCSFSPCRASHCGCFSCYGAQVQ